MIERPIRMPIGTPTTTAMPTADQECAAGDQQRLEEARRRHDLADAQDDRGQRRQDEAGLRCDPTISQMIAHRMSDAIIGTRYAGDRSWCDLSPDTASGSARCSRPRRDSRDRGGCRSGSPPRSSFGSMIAETRLGRREQQHDAVRDVDRLLDAVRDEQEGLASRWRSSASRSSWNLRRVCSSTAENGSSISTTLASTASARARPTRWRMPPESSCGYLCSKPLRPTFAMCRSATASRSDLRDAAQLQPEGDVAHHGRPRHQREVLEDEGALGPGAGHGRAADQDLAAGRRHQPGDDLEQCGLAAARGTEQRRQLPFGEIERDSPMSASTPPG